MTFRFFVTLSILALLLAIPAGATVITFSSDLLNEGNSKTGANVFIIPVDSWATAPWVSDANTGKGGTSPPNTTIYGAPTAVFTETITLPNGNNSGWMTFWADDTMAVWLFNSLYPNGLMLHNANNTPSPHCAGQPVGCVEGMSWTGTYGLGVFAQGVNTLSLPTYQLWDDGFGIAYRGEITSIPSGVPEPMSFILIGTGLVGLGLLRRRRKTTQ